MLWIGQLQLQRLLRPDKGIRRHMHSSLEWPVDLTHGYRMAVMIAAGGNALGLLVALGLPHPPEPEDSESSARRW